MSLGGGHLTEKFFDYPVVVVTFDHALYVGINVICFDDEGVRSRVGLLVLVHRD